MYKVLLVDDEPIILTGTKFLIDWEACGCEIVGTAFNGLEALDKIRQLNPDIVLCDIRMPSLSGIDLLKQVQSEMPHIVFIMLTNYQDFELACEALRYHAADYLIKTSLTPETLKKALEAAKLECSNRSRLVNMDTVQQHLIVLPKRKVLAGIAINSLISHEKKLSAGDIEIMQDLNVHTGYGVLVFPFEIPREQSSGSGSVGEGSRLLMWQKDITEKLIKNFFPDCILPDSAGSEAILYALCWGMDAREWKERLPTLRTRLLAASANITRLNLQMLATGHFSGTDQAPECHRQVGALQDYYYLTGESKIIGDDLPAVEYEPLSLSGVSSRLAAEIKSKNAGGVKAVLSRIISQVQSVCHQKKQAVWLCNDLLNEIGNSGKRELISQYADAYREVEGFTTRVQVLTWLERLKNQLCGMLEQHDPGKMRLLEDARQYVLSNITTRITLQEVAEQVNLSSSYLSTLFKKHYNQSFVDFVNQSKIDYACRLIREGNYKFYEISYMLGFENAYYFSRVFRKCTGMTPTEYQQTLSATHT